MNDGTRDPRPPELELDDPYSMSPFEYAAKRREKLMTSNVRNYSPRVHKYYAQRLNRPPLTNPTYTMQRTQSQPQPPPNILNWSTPPQPQRANTYPSPTNMQNQYPQQQQQASPNFLDQPPAQQQDTQNEKAPMSTLVGISICICVLTLMTIGGIAVISFGDKDKKKEQKEKKNKKKKKGSENDDPCTLDNLHLIGSEWKCIAPEDHCKKFEDKLFSFKASRKDTKNGVGIGKHFMIERRPKTAIEGWFPNDNDGRHCVGTVLWDPTKPKEESAIEMRIGRPRSMEISRPHGDAEKDTKYKFEKEESDDDEDDEEEDEEEDDDESDDKGKGKKRRRNLDSNGATSNAYHYVMSYDTLFAIIFVAITACLQAFYLYHR